MVRQEVLQPVFGEESTLSQELSFGPRAGSCFKISILPHSITVFHPATYLLYAELIRGATNDAQG